jgi:hypothetical protein
MTEPKSKRMTPEEQLERFKETAKELGVDEKPGALDRAFKKIDPKTPPEAPKPKAK